MPSFGLSNLLLFLEALQQPPEVDTIIFQDPEKEKDWP